MNLQMAKRILFGLSIFNAVLNFSFTLWFFFSAEIASLDTASFDYCDILLILLFLEFLFIIVSVIGFFHMPETISISFFSIAIFLFVFVKLIFLIMFFLREENKLFWAESRYLRAKNRDIPNKLQAFETVYLGSPILLVLESVFTGLALYFSYKQECFNEENRGNREYYIEIH